MASTFDTVTVTPATVTLPVGGTIALIATPTDAQGNLVLISASTLKWSTSAAAVDASGNVTAVAVGTATITATESESGVSGTATLTITTAPTPTLTPSPTPTPGPAGSIFFSSPTSYSAPGAGDIIAAVLDGATAIQISPSLPRAMSLSSGIVATARLRRVGPSLPAPATHPIRMPPPT